LRLGLGLGLGWMWCPYGRESDTVGEDAPNSLSRWVAPYMSATSTRPAVAELLSTPASSPRLRLRPLWLSSLGAGESMSCWYWRRSVRYLGTQWQASPTGFVTHHPLSMCGAMGSIQWQRTARWFRGSAQNMIARQRQLPATLAVRRCPLLPCHPVLPQTC